MIFETRLAQCQQHINLLLPQYLPAPIEDSVLYEAMHYSCLNGGKRFRSLLIYTTAELLEKSRQRVDPLAVAIEFIHCYSLIHDDLPCMDNDDMRRGKPTCHRQFDEATAILAGDALLTLAFEILSTPSFFQNSDPLLLLEIVRKVSAAIGANQGMVQGQFVDLQAQKGVLHPFQLDDLLSMHQAKTGALIQTSIECAALLCGEVNTEQCYALSEFGKNLGLAFQIQDDILDAIGNSETMGKRAQKDQEINKTTFVSLLGLEQAQDFAKKLHNKAIMSLKPFGSQAATFMEIADFTIGRVA